MLEREIEAVIRSQETKAYEEKVNRLLYHHFRFVKVN